MLIKNSEHPSLHLKRMKNTDIWEMRVDYHYRLTFQMMNDCASILAIGMHDTGLGKK